MTDEKIRTMEDFHCEMLELSLRFKAEDIDQDAFLKAAGVENRQEYTDEDGDFAMGMNLSGREQSTDYHAHMKVQFFKEGRNRIDISYHESKAEAVDDKPPYAEDCAQWVGSFFKVDKVTARISAAYTFDKSFSPVISLPFPLISSEKALAGSVVTGLSILFPKETGTETVIIQAGSDDDTMMFFNTKAELRLREFDLLNELKKLSVSVNPLVKQQETNSENRKDNQ